MQRIRLTEKRYPLLSLKKGDMFYYTIADELMPFADDINGYAKAYGNLDKLNPLYITKGFLDAAITAWDKIVTPENIATFSEENDIPTADLKFCWIRDGLMNLTFFKHDDNRFGVVTLQFDKNAITGVSVFGYDYNTYKYLHGGENLSYEHSNPSKTAVLAYLFMIHADVEIRQLPPKAKKEIFNCRYKSDLPITVNMIDCRWFTDLVQSNPFWVKGHWKFQPHGAGNQLRKLIWVDPYVKSGYTLKAKKDAA